MTVATIRVPASAANLGAGFDCIGIAVDRWLTASARAEHAPADDARAMRSVIVRRSGTLATLDAEPRDDQLYVGFAAACKARGALVPRQIEFDVTSEIPVSRGLGSSSAALVAGAALANAMLELGLGATQLATLCANIEGHPDNVAPAIYGGAVLGVPLERGRYVFTPLVVHPELAFVFAVPEFTVSTEAARALLPAHVPHAVAVSAASKSAALVQGLAAGNAELLAAALDDVLHVPHRRALIAAYDEVVAAARAAGAYGATLSGSGSTLMAIAPRDVAGRVRDAMCTRWRECGEASEAFVAGAVCTSVI
ncbi:MAG: homoserine kinase [Gemmatimonadaceae bacterium]